MLALCIIDCYRKPEEFIIRTQEPNTCQNVNTSIIDFTIDCVKLHCATCANHLSCLHSQR